MGYTKAKDGMSGKKKSCTCDHLMVREARLNLISQFFYCEKHKKRLGKFGKEIVMDTPETKERCYETNYAVSFELPLEVYPCVKFADTDECPIEADANYPNSGSKGGCFGLFAVLGGMLAAGICGLALFMTIGIL